MADSYITKRALADGLKELMKKQSFEKITIAQICNTSHMSRQSFYYHFKDKYDLMCWIADADFAPIYDLTDEENRWLIVEEICNIFYQNKIFYQEALQTTGPNSLANHFHKSMFPMLHMRLKYILLQSASVLPEQYEDFCVNVCCDMILCSINRWILDKNDITPDAFISILHALTQNITPAILHTLTTK